MIAMRPEAVAAIAERSRIARELHDGLRQDAMTIALRLRAVLAEVRAASETAARALVRYAEARTVRLTVAFESRRLRVTIDDDGQGFDSDHIGADDHFRSDRHA